MALRHNARDVQKKLGLSPSQKQAVRAGGRQYSDKLQALFSERETLRGMLEVGTPAPPARSLLVHIGILDIPCWKTCYVSHDTMRCIYFRA